MIPTRQSVECSLKLAAIVSHAELLIASLDGGGLTVDALRALLADHDIGTWLDSFDPLLLPYPLAPKESRAA